MCNCLFCGHEMEDEEKLIDFHVCPPDQNISLNEIRAYMSVVLEEEDDGWDAWSRLVDFLDRKSVPANTSQ